jgi:hypothetical protein
LVKVAFKASTELRHLEFCPIVAKFEARIEREDDNLRASHVSHVGDRAEREVKVLVLSISETRTGQKITETGRVLGLYVFLEEW